MTTTTSPQPAVGADPAPRADAPNAGPGAGGAVPRPSPVPRDPSAARRAAAPARRHLLPGRTAALLFPLARHHDLVTARRRLRALAVMTSGLGTAAAVTLGGIGIPAAAPGATQPMADDRVDPAATGLAPGSGMGPLQIPSIGVLPPGGEDWFTSGYSPAAAYDVLPQASTSPAVPWPTPSAGDAGAQPLDQVPAPAEPPPPAGPVPPADPLQPTAPGAPDETPPAASKPPAEKPPAGGPGTGGPPAGEPALETPPVETPPAEVPSAEEPVGEEPAPEAPPAEEPPGAQPPAVVLNARGNQVLAPGTALELREPTTGDLVLSVAVEEVLPGAACTEPAVASRNGALVALRLTVTTGADLSALQGARSVVPADFGSVGDDGALLADVVPAATCTPPAAALPAGPLVPSQVLTGTVALDLPRSAGAVLYSPEWLATGGEWTLPTQAAAP